MIRFWAASLLLHVVLYGAMNWRPTTPIENPIVSVTLVENFAVASPAMPTKSPASNSTGPRTSHTHNSALTRSPVAITNPQISEIDSQNGKALKDSSSTPQNILNSEAGLSEVDVGTVSRRPRVLRQFKAGYPQTAKDARVEGPVKLSVLIDSGGRVQEVDVIEGPGHGLNELAQDALKKFIFSPAEKLGEKVPVRIVYIYRFRLESR